MHVDGWLRMVLTLCELTFIHVAHVQDQVMTMAILFIRCNVDTQGANLTPVLTEIPVILWEDQ